MNNFIDDLKAIYSKAGYIRILDPHALEIGIRPGENVVILSLIDAGRLTGHICPAVTSAFFIVKSALKNLSPDQIPSREKFLVAVPKYDDMALVFSYVLDAFPAPKDDPEAVPRMFLDKSLANDKENVKFIFKNTDTNKTICITWKKQIAMPPEIRQKMMEYKNKSINGKYEYLDYLGWNTFVNAQVERIINDSSFNMLDIEEIEYDFPGQMKMSLL